MTSPIGLAALDIDQVPAIEIGPGCSRRDLPSRDGIRVWVVDMEAGAQWPHVDHHDLGGENVFVASGELIEGDQRLGAGTYLHFGPNSSHRPRTETGVRLYGFNMLLA